MPKAIFINGHMLPPERATVSVYDHGLLYGDGVFEGERIYGGRIFRLDEHTNRLFESARAIRLEVPYSFEEVKRFQKQTVAENGIADGYIRMVLTRGSGALGLDIDRTSDPQLIIIADTISLYPAEMYEDGLKLITASTIRNHPNALSPRIKSLNYLNNIMAKIEGKDAGCVEAVMLNVKGEVAECTGDNLFIVKDGVLKTPPTDAGILEGVTRNVVMELAGQLGIECRQTALVRHDIYTADECFLTGSAAEVIAAVSLDGRLIGDGKPGPVTGRLLEAFRAYTRDFEED